MMNFYPFPWEFVHFVVNALAWNAQICVVESVIAVKDVQVVFLAISVLIVELISSHPHMVIMTTNSALHI